MSAGFSGPSDVFVMLAEIHYVNSLVVNQAVIS